jgi:hypothetical protein
MVNMNEPQRHSSRIVEKEKYDDHSNPSNSADTDSGNARLDEPREPLPLEWTRLQRQRKAITGTSNNIINDNTNISSKKKRSISSVNDEGEDGQVEGCNDVYCRGCGASQSQLQFESNDVNMGQMSTEGSENHYNLSGKIIFCLPDQDCEWFQGYFFPLEKDDIDLFQLPSTDCPSYGVLCTVKQDIDECLQCNAGGYREISTIQMTKLNERRTFDDDIMGTTIASTINNEPTAYPKRINVSNVTWVGGDMMSLCKTVSYSKANAALFTKVKSPSPTTTATTTATTDPNDVPPTMPVLQMQTTTLYTGSDRVSPYVQRFFSKYLRYLMDSYNSQNALSIDGRTTNDVPTALPQLSLSDDNYKQAIEVLMPDVAIVVGTMKLRVA